MCARNIQVITFLHALLLVELVSRRRKSCTDQDLEFLLVERVPERPPPFFEDFLPVFRRGRYTNGFQETTEIAISIAMSSST